MGHGEEDAAPRVPVAVCEELIVHHKMVASRMLRNADVLSKHVAIEVYPDAKEIDIDFAVPYGRDDIHLRLEIRSQAFNRLLAKMMQADRVP